MVTKHSKKNSINCSDINDLKRPVLIPAGLLVCLLLVIFFYTLYSQEINNNNEKMTHLISSVEQSFLQKIDKKAFYLASQIHYFNNNICISSALSEQNLQRLKECSHFIVEQLQNTFELKELNYVSRDKNYLLEIYPKETPLMHKGDNKSHHFITEKAINTQQNSYGIELSHNISLQLTMSFPLIANSTIVAYVEIITDVWDIIDSLEDNYDTLLYIFIEKQILEESGEKAFYIEQYENLELPPWDFLDTHILLYGDDNFLGKEFRKFYGKESSLNKSRQINFTTHGQYFTLGHFPLLNGSGSFIGHIGLISDDTVNMKNIHQLLIRFIITYLVLTAVLFFLFYHYIHKLEKQLNNYFNALKEEVVERKQAESALKKLSNAVEHSGSVVVITDKSGKIEYVNPSFTEVTGFSAEEIMGTISTGLQKQNNKKLWDTILAGKCWVNDIENKRKNGEHYWSRLSISPIFNDDNEIVHFVEVSEDISELKKAHDTMRHMAFYDALTGLPNRRLFLDRLKQTLERNTRNQTTAAIFFLDLDKFKKINDTLGHAAGDILLKEIALRLQLLLRTSDTVARQGGDEFTMILDNISDQDDVELLAQKIIQNLSAPMNLMGTTASISVSIGITLTSIDANSVEQLLKNADIAMYEAKRRGRNRYCFYNQ